jgi:hypothetical protein
LLAPVVFISTVLILEVAFAHSSSISAMHGPNGFKDLQMLTANPCLSAGPR